MKSILSRPAQFLVYLVYRLVEGGIGLLSVESCIRIGETLGFAVSRVARPYRRLVHRNMTLALKDEYSPAQIETLVDDHFAALGKNMICSVRTSLLSPEEIDGILTIDGLENCSKANAEGKGLIMCVNHLSNWEFFTRVKPGGLDSGQGTIYQRLRNPYLNRHVEKLRGRDGTLGFDRQAGFVAPADFVRGGGALGVLFDQHPGPRGILCPFFNRLVATTTLPAILSLRTGAPIVYSYLQPEGPGKWRCVFTDPVFPGKEVGREEYINQVTARLNRRLEDTIRQNPAEWFWVHNRWKSTPRAVLSTGPRLKLFVPEDVPLEKLTTFRLAVWSPNPLGDACMSLPAVRALKKGRPDMHLTVCCRENLAPMWRAQEEVDEVIAFKKGLKPREVGAMIREGREPIEVAVLLPNSLRSALEAKAAGIPCRIGFRGHHRKRLLKFAVPEPPARTENKHHVHRYLHLVKEIGGDIRDVDSLLQIPPAPTPLGGDQSEIHIGVCPGAEYGNAKRYPIERYAAALESLRERNPQTKFRISIFGSPAEGGIGEELASLLSEPRDNRAGKTTVADLVDELRTCHFVVTNDTGTMHLSAALGVPTVAIFGSTEPELTSPIGDVHRVIRHKVDCSPCFKRECPIDYRCMLRIEPEVVVAEMEALLKS